MKNIPVYKVKEGDVVYMGHINFYVMEVGSTSRGDVILRGTYSDPLPTDYPTASQVFDAGDFVTIY